MSKYACDRRSKEDAAKMLAILPRQRTNLVFDFVVAGDRGGYAAARRKRSYHPATSRRARGHEIVEQPIDDVFVIDALIAKTLQIQLERFELHAPVGGNVRIGDGPEIRLPRHRAHAGKLGADDLDGEIATRIGVRKSIQLARMRCTSIRHENVLLKTPGLDILCQL
jgi:hypothetical protein